jgi:hypothetical protein
MSKKSTEGVVKRLSGFFSGAVEKKHDRSKSASPILKSDSSMNADQSKDQNKLEISDLDLNHDRSGSQQLQSLGKSSIPLSQLTVGMSLRVNKNYIAANLTELDVIEGDVIELVSLPQIDQLFWLGVSRSWGENNGKEGLFPCSFVEVYKSI